eukprot:1966422-Rhodomonas_salina.1
MSEPTTNATSATKCCGSLASRLPPPSLLYGATESSATESVNSGTDAVRCYCEMLPSRCSLVLLNLPVPRPS